MRSGLENMRAAIFDLDGTLLDSLHIWEDIDEEFLQKRGLAVPEGYCETIASMGFLDAADYAKKRFGFPESPEAIVAEWNDMAAHRYGNVIQMKPGARDYLAKLRDRGILLAVATALPEKLYRPALRHHGIETWFGAVASTDETSRGKGYPDVYRLAAKRLGVSPEHCVVFEDILPGIQGAKAAGMKTMGVYDACSSGIQEDLQRLADGYIQSFEELL